MFSGNSPATGMIVPWKYWWSAMWRNQVWPCHGKPILWAVAWCWSCHQCWVMPEIATWPSTFFEDSRNLALLAEQEEYFFMVEAGWEKGNGQRLDRQSCQGGHFRHVVSQVLHQGAIFVCHFHSWFDNRCWLLVWNQCSVKAESNTTMGHWAQALYSGHKLVLVESLHCRPIHYNLMNKETAFTPAIMSNYLFLWEWFMTRAHILERILGLIIDDTICMKKELQAFLDTTAKWRDYFEESRGKSWWRHQALSCFCSWGTARHSWGFDWMARDHRFRDLSMPTLLTTLLWAPCWRLQVNISKKLILLHNP